MGNLPNENLTENTPAEKVAPVGDAGIAPVGDAPAAPAAPAGKKRAAGFFSYQRILLIITVFFGAWFIGSVIAGATNGYHHAYDEAQANLVVSQNFRILFILLVPYVLEKLFGLRIDLKILVSLYLFGFVSTVIGETFTVYYRVELFDKILHGISGFIALYLSYGFVYAALKNGTGKHKFAVSVLLGVIVALGVAALWEMIEFTYDLMFGTNMQKLTPPQFYNGGNTFADLPGTDEEIAAYFRKPEGYKYALMDSMWDMLVAFLASIAFAVIMFVIKAVKKDAFEKCVICDPDLRLAAIKNRKRKSGQKEGGNGGEAGNPDGKN